MDMKKWSLKKQDKVVSYLIVVAISFYVVHSIIESIALYNCIECSAPWHIALLFTTVIWVFPITLLILFKIALVLRIKKKKTSF